MSTTQFTAAVPKRADYQQLESSDDLARILLAYFAAYAVEAGVKELPLDKTILVTPVTAWRIGRGFWHFGIEVSHSVWPIPMAMWLAVDEAGNAFEHGSEGVATLLTFKNLRRRSADELQMLLDSCDPFGDYYQ